MTMRIPHFWQETEYHCGPAVVQMLLYGIGIRRSQKTLGRELLTTPKDGTSVTNIVKILRRYGLSVSMRRQSSLADLRILIGQNIPVVVLYREPSDNEGHYAIVTRASDKTLILHDPWNGKNFRISTVSFAKRWKSSSGFWQRLLIAVRPQLR